MTKNEKQFLFSASLGLLLTYAASKGYTISLRGVYRAKDYQRRLYEIGRTRELNSKPVTWTLDSKHCDSLAADIIVFENGQPVWDAKHPIYLELATVWEDLGGEWGGRWGRVDAPHFQYSDKMLSKEV